MLPLLPTTSYFKADQQVTTTVETWDTPYPVLEGGAPSGGLIMDVREPTASGTWSLPAQLKAAALNIDILTTVFKSSTYSRAALDSGRSAVAVRYWAAGAPSRDGASVNGRVAFHFRSYLRDGAARAFWDAAATPTWHLAMAGQGWVRIDRVESAGTVVTTIFTGQLSEADYLVNGFQFTPSITTVTAGEWLDIYYVQDVHDPWGGFVFKAVSDPAPASRAAGQEAARLAPVLGCDIADDDRARAGTLPARALGAWESIEIQRRRGQAAAATITIPLANLQQFDGQGWVLNEVSGSVPDTLRYYVGGALQYDLKRQRLVRIVTGVVGETTTVFTGFIDDWEVETGGGSGRVKLSCLDFAHRVLEHYDRNYPDRISYMSRGYKRLTGTSEPVYNVAAFDNWPLQFAIEELCVRAGLGGAATQQPKTVAKADGTAVAVVMDGETFLKLRAKALTGDLLRNDRAVRYGNTGLAFNEVRPVDDPYLFKPEVTQDLWKRALDLCERVGYDLRVDAFGHVELAPRNNPHAVYDFTVASGGTSPQLAVHPSAHAGTYVEYVGPSSLIQETVQGARIDVSVPRFAGSGEWRFEVRRVSDNALMANVTVNPSLTTGSPSEFFYDFRTTVDGKNSTVATLYSGDFNTYRVDAYTSGGIAGTVRRLDCLLTYHTDPVLPRLPQPLSTAINAVQVGTRGAMGDMRNAVIVVGRRQATVTDSDKFGQNPENPEREFVVSNAVNVGSIADPSAADYVGYAREAVIYDEKIADRDKAEWVARTFIHRQRSPKPGATAEHTILPVVELADPVYVVEDRHASVQATRPLWIQEISHTISATGRAVTRVEASPYAEFPSYEPRQDIDIDDLTLGFAGKPVAGVEVSYTSLSGHLKTNLDESAIAASEDTHIITVSNLSVQTGPPAYLQIPSAGASPWPPIPGTLQISVTSPATAGGSTTVYSGDLVPTKAGATFPPIYVSNAVQITSVQVEGYHKVNGVDVITNTFTLSSTARTPSSGSLFEPYQWIKELNQILVTMLPRTTTNLFTYITFGAATFIRVKVVYVRGESGIKSGYLANTPYHHYYNIDYRDSNRIVQLPWKEGDSSSPYTRPTGINNFSVRYRRMPGTVFNETGLVADPYNGQSPFYDPYTSELGYLVQCKFDALVSGLYRVSIRNLNTHQVVAWLTEPTQEVTEPEAHWQFMQAGAGKAFYWDGVDQIGSWNQEQSQLYADSAKGAFEQDQRPVVGAGFLVWNQETDAGNPGRLALISAERVAATGEPVWGVGTYASWYLYVEAKNDKLEAVAENNAGDASKQLPRTVATHGSDVDVQFTGGADAAVIFTHLGKPARLEVSVADWDVAASVFDENNAATSGAGYNNGANWHTDPIGDTSNNPDAIISNQRPTRFRFTVVNRPGTLWTSKQGEQTVRLVRHVHLRATIMDQLVLWDGTTYAPSPFRKQTVANRRLVNDTHTIEYRDEGYRRADSFKQVDGVEGTEWIFVPKFFKKNFRGVENEPITFGDYLQLEELPYWDPNRQVAGTRSRFQIAFMNYLFYLSAYVQDRSGRMTWGVNTRFLDKTKILKNAYGDWWNPAVPTEAATSTTYRTPWPEDPTLYLRRTVVTRQWTNEGVSTAFDWRIAQRARFGITSGSIGDQLLRHKWKDHEPTRNEINGQLWFFFSLASDSVSRNLKSRNRLSSTGESYTHLSLSYPVDAENRQMPVTGLGLWTWETSPTWYPCITRDFHPYFLVPPMVDQGYGDNQLGGIPGSGQNYWYGSVDGRGRNTDAGKNEGDDVAAGDVWSTAANDMTVAYAAGNDWAGRFVAPGTKSQSNETGSNIFARTMDYVRQDELVHYEDLRGLYSRGPRPSEQTKKVTPVMPYYYNPMDYEAITVGSARGQQSIPLYKTKMSAWFGMKFRQEYYWECGYFFPVSERGLEALFAFNMRLAMTRAENAAIAPGVRYDSGAWTGWKDDRRTNLDAQPDESDATYYKIQHTGSIFSSGYMPVAVGPQLAGVTRDMIFHMVLVNERRGSPISL